MLYFAYGSNLDFTQMRERCPSAQFVAIACLPAHRLAFTRKSVKRGCGVADVVVEAAQQAWGVVYNILEAEIGLLDLSEGFQPGRPLSDNSYVREERHVLRDGEKSHPLLVSIYIANRQINPPLPSNTYKSQIVEGAKFWHLPENYIRHLELIETL